MVRKGENQQYYEDDIPESEIHEDNDEDYSFNSTDNEPRENSYSVMKNFFDTDKFLYRKEMEWKGFTLRDGKFVKTNKPIACDSFINELIGSLRSVINQHSSVSYKSQEEANRISFEAFQAFCESVADEPSFQGSRFSLIKEEFDHAIELFMGHVIKGHGQRTAIALQTGIVSENAIKSENKGVLSGLRNMFDKNN